MNIKLLTLMSALMLSTTLPSSAATMNEFEEEEIENASPSAWGPARLGHFYVP